MRVTDMDEKQMKAKVSLQLLYFEKQKEIGICLIEGNVGVYNIIEDAKIISHFNDVIHAIDYASNIAHSRKKKILIVRQDMMRFIPYPVSERWDC